MRIKNKIMKKTILICLTSMLAVHTSAQVQTLEPVVVSTSEHQKKLRESGRNISVMTREDIQRLPVNTIDDLLKFVSGIEIQQRGPQGSQTDFVIRGGTFQQVLVVVDGMRMNEPLTGHFNNYIPVPLQEIERIEVIKGAAAAMFGPDAVGGVISITTKTFSHDFGKKKRELSIGLQRGQFGLKNNNIHVAAGNRKNLLSWSGQSNRATGPELRGTTQFFNNRVNSLSYGRKLNRDWRLMLRASFDNRNFNAQNFYTTFLSDTAREQVTSSWQQAALQHNGKKSTFTLMGAARQLEDIYTFRPAVTPNNNKSALFNIDMRNTTRLSWQQAKLTWGTQWFNKRIRSNDRGNHEHAHAGGYINLQHQPLPKLFVTEGLRADWDAGYKWVLIPQLNLAYVGQKGALRGSIGKGIRDADFTERYNNYNKALVTSGSIGNPALRAERSINMELGGDLNLTDNIQARATWFRRNQNGLIDWTVTPYANMPRQINLSPTGTYALASNIASVNTRGMELDLEGRHRFKKGTQLTWRSGLTLLRSLTPLSTSPSFYLSSHAKTIWNTSFSFSGKRGAISLATNYKLRNTLNAPNINAKISPNYFITSIRAEKYFLKGRLAVQLQADNLFNTSYSDLLGSVMPGRWIQVGGRIGLDRKKD